MFCFKFDKSVCVIDYDTALYQCTGNEELLKKLLVKSYKNIKDPLEQIIHDSHDSIKKYAHMVKGVSKNLYLKDIELNSIALEKASREGDSKEIKKQIKYMNKNVDNLEKFIKSKNIKI